MGVANVYWGMFFENQRIDIARYLIKSSIGFQISINNILYNLVYYKGTFVPPEYRPEGTTYFSPMATPWVKFYYSKLSP